MTAMTAISPESQRGNEGPQFRADASDDGPRVRQLVDRLGGLGRRVRDPNSTGHRARRQASPAWKKVRKQAARLP